MQYAFDLCFITQSYLRLCVWKKQHDILGISTSSLVTAVQKMKPTLKVCIKHVLVSLEVPHSAIVSNLTGGIFPQTMCFFTM